MLNFFKVKKNYSEKNINIYSYIIKRKWVMVHRKIFQNETVLEPCFQSPWGDNCLWLVLKKDLAFSFVTLGMEPERTFLLLKGTLQSVLSVWGKLTWFYLSPEEDRVLKEKHAKEQGFLNLPTPSCGELWLGMNANFSGLNFDFIFFNYLVLIWNTLVQIFSFFYVILHVIVFTGT